VQDADFRRDSGSSRSKLQQGWKVHHISWNSTASRVH